MKNIHNFWITAMIALSIQSQTSFAQKIDDERMKRDIEVAENVLATLIKQEFEQQRTFFGLDVKGSYQPGYGVTFRVPSDHSMPFVISIGRDNVQGATVISEGDSYQYSFRTNGSNRGELAEGNEVKLRNKSEEKKWASADSVRANYNNRIISAAQNFILDYGDFISQLAPNERIVVTNQNDRPHFYFNSGKRTRISVEGTRGDITSFKQGKLTREQAVKKLSVVNTESIEAREPDMEMLSSIFSRLYRPDLSKTYFTEGNVYYERLKDFGTIFYMQMVSSVEKSMNRYAIPTLGLEGLDQAARDKKVAELYPVFEKDIKENILEYGRTLKSLKDDESLIFNITLTRCKGCGIPSTLELTLKGSVLKEFGAGRMEKNTALDKILIKKGANQ